MKVAMDNNKARRSAALIGRTVRCGLVLAAVTVTNAQQPAEIIVRNGTIVNATGRTDGDVRIRNGTIAEIGRNLTAGAGAREIDAGLRAARHGALDLPAVERERERLAGELREAKNSAEAIHRPSGSGLNVAPQTSPLLPWRQRRYLLHLLR